VFAIPKVWSRSAQTVFRKKAFLDTLTEVCSRMSHLKLYRPPEGDRVFRFDTPEPTVLPFKPHFQNRLRTRPLEGEGQIARAKLLHENRTCPHCDRPMVEPLELDDAVYNQNGLPIPGTATLVGFHCLNCGSEWPA